jgi:hypothetical protein
MSQDRILQKLIFSQFEEVLTQAQIDKGERTQARIAFEDKLIKQSEQYSEVVQSYLDVIPGKALGVAKVPLTTREIADLPDNSDDPEKHRALVAAGKLKSPIEDTFSGRDIEAVKELLKHLKKDGKLYNALVLYANIHTANGTHTDAEKKSIVINCLNNAGVLPVIQYVICDSLLTGGIGCAQEPNKQTQKNLIKELAPLIMATGLSFEDFFTLCNPRLVMHKSLLTMAAELDEPEMLLAVMGNKQAFSESDAKAICEDITKQTILNHVILNDKMAIEKRIQQDIANAKKQRALIKPMPKRGDLTVSKGMVQAPGGLAVDDEKITPKSARNSSSYKAMPTRSAASASAPSLPSIALSPLHLHAVKPSETLNNSTICHLIIAAANITHAAEDYLKNYPTPVGYIYSHTHQTEARALIQLGTDFFGPIVDAEPKQYAEIASKFIAKFNRLMTKLSAGELKNNLNQPAINDPLKIVVNGLLRLQRLSTTNSRTLSSQAKVDMDIDVSDCQRTFSP